MTKLSPAAQAVLDAYRSSWLDEPMDTDEECLAAALRAAAEQAEPDDGVSIEVWQVLNKIYDIADELEAQ